MRVESSIATTAAASTKPLRVLILGGTGFIGPHFVNASLRCGHEVSVFSRGKERAELPASVERLVGDRSGDLNAIVDRDWDAVFDLATPYSPNWVRTLGDALRGRVKHYTFISTIVTYVFPGARNEESPVRSYKEAEDAYELKSPPSTLDQIGALKALCEREAERQFPGRTLILRPGHIVGPREHVGTFTYWVVRMQQGGEVLAGGDPRTPVQLIDVRDLAEWAVFMAEGGSTGVFNAVGPAMPMGWGEMLGAIRGMSSNATSLTWVPVPWLMERKVPAFSSFLFWPAESGNVPGIWKMGNEKARANGLVFRPLNVTIADTLAWYSELSAERQREVILSAEETIATWDDLIGRERELLAAWHAH